MWKFESFNDRVINRQLNHYREKELSDVLEQRKSKKQAKLTEALGESPVMASTDKKTWNVQSHLLPVQGGDETQGTNIDSLLN